MHCVSSGKNFGVKTQGMASDLEKKVERERKARRDRHFSA